MFDHRTARLVSIGLLGCLGFPALTYLDDEKRTHARHATCEHYLRHHHPDPADRAAVLAREACRQRAAQERAQAADARRALRQALQDDDAPTTQAAVVYDSKLMKGRRKWKVHRDDCEIKEPPRIPSLGVFPAMLLPRPE